MAIPTRAVASFDGIIAAHLTFYGRFAGRSSKLPRMKKSRRFVYVGVFCALVAASCDRTPPEMKAIVDAANAMGGRQKVVTVKTLTIEGEGDAPNAGQNTMPDSDLPNWKITEFKRIVDLANHRMRTEQFRTAQFLFANANTQRINQSLDADIAFNTGADGSAVRAPATAVKDRRVEMLHHPLVIIRMALDDPDTKISGFRTAGSQQVVEIDTKQGDHVTLALDGTTHLPTRV